MHPPILVCPSDPECQLNDQEIQDLAKMMEEMEDGEVFVSGVSLSIYHKIEGMWINSDDLAEMLGEKDEKGQKHIPAESTYVPPECREEDE